MVAWNVRASTIHPLFPAPESSLETLLWSCPGNSAEQPGDSERFLSTGYVEIDAAVNRPIR